MLTFDAATARFLEETYLGSDFVRRRLANLEALAPQSGDRVIDVGCGPGFLTLELARAVGENGQVIGVDPSSDMRAAAGTRCAGRDTVQIVDGTAKSLPVDSTSVDRAVSVQVFEYVRDIPAALAEIRRVLRPGGRLVVGDFHWDSLVWFSADPDRMARMLAIWDEHLAERRVPALLAPLLRAAGFAPESVWPLTIVDTTLRPDGFARMLLRLVESFARDRPVADADATHAWAEEQARLVAEGRFFLSVTHYVIAARKL